jgi:hypothetical protein
LNQTIPDDLVPILAKDENKQREIREKASQDAASGSARAIGVTATLNPSPSASRVPIPTSAKITAARAKQPVVAPAATKAPVAGTSTSVVKPVATKPTELGKKQSVNMYIQPIPPFKGMKRSPTPSRGTATQTNGAAVPTSPTSTARLNANASSFRPNTKANAFNPVKLIVGFRIPRYWLMFLSAYLAAYVSHSEFHVGFYVA